MKLDISGKKFGRLTVIEDSSERAYDGGIIWKCKCTCGNYCQIRGSKLKSGYTNSCGCLKKEAAKNMNTKNKPKHVENTSLYQINDRKINKNNTSGTKGVHFVNRTNKWGAKLTLRGKIVYLRYFDNKQDAINARTEAEEKYFKPILEKYTEKY